MMELTNNNAFSFAQPHWLGDVDSTSTWLKARVARGGVATGFVVAAHRQTGARGRMGNAWKPSPRGDLAFSFYWTGRLATPLAAGTLPMACALGVRDFLAVPPWAVTALCKWPNDVLVDDRKICGILTEGGTSPEGVFGLVVGIGVNLRPFPERDRELGKKTAALEEFAGDVGTADALLGPLLACLEKRIRQWEHDGPTGVVGAMRKTLWGVGRTVRARTRECVVTGTVEGIGDDGELLLGTDDGTVVVSSVHALEDGWE